MIESFWKAPIPGDRPVCVVRWNRLQHRVQPLTRLGRRDGCRRRLGSGLGRRGHELGALGGVLAQAQVPHTRGLLFVGPPHANRWPGGLGLAGGLIMQVPGDGVEEVATDLAGLTRLRHGGAYTGNIRPKSAT